jgi:hypothetical protein
MKRPKKVQTPNAERSIKFCNLFIANVLCLAYSYLKASELKKRFSSPSKGLKETPDSTSEKQDEKQLWTNLVQRQNKKIFLEWTSKYIVHSIC